MGGGAAGNFKDFPSASRTTTAVLPPAWDSKFIPGRSHEQFTSSQLVAFWLVEGLCEETLEREQEFIVRPVTSIRRAVLDVFGSLEIVREIQG